MGAPLYVGSATPDQPRSREPAPTLRLQHGAAHLHRLGARATAEFLAEIVRAHAIEADTLDRLDRWRDVTPEMCRAAGGCAFPPALTEVPR